MLEQMPGKLVPGRTRIVVNGLRVMARHGVLPGERVEEQPFVIDVELIVDEPDADELSRAVSYADIARRAVRQVETTPVNLIETLAARIADSCRELPGIHAVAVCVHKPQAPIGFPFQDVSVTVVRDSGNTEQPA
ncbi:dihydroneopterin aldolase [Propionibacterium australiense]|uniref:7,8-dihydroneopterin aldolase n=1 Tax=Propionibacterium australiense TaxID=119981 RepID=A0A383S5V7_9ACTN|nr:dihydroneopterin aldolase [Propionibacterium australiense]SYZ33213.1 dihydroneopterin aldolase [Propionibacterium australiense]VEH89313.1 Probable dihydroneopterin aldolase [Propionibacterium australiense]